MFLVLSISVLFISIMQSVNGAQFLNTTSLRTFSGFAGASTRVTVIFPLKVCMRHYDHINLTLTLKF